MVIEANEIVMQYGTLTAVNKLSMGVSKGICFGLLGPNGAGKTTTIEIMEGIRQPTSGTVLFHGKKRSRVFKEKIGIQFQQTALQDFITVEETIRLFSRLYQYSRPIEEIVELCNLQDIMKRDNRKISGGQRQRLLLALALINNPELIFLDEPTTGLDPQARRNFWNLVEKIKNENRTLILTTHYMEEAEILCDEIAIMNHGNIIAQGSPGELVQKHFEGVIIRLPLQNNSASLPDNAVVYDNYVDVHSNAVDKTIKELSRKEISLDGLSIHKPNLDDLFLKLTGTSLRD